jgi:uncharacterized protein YbjT (DUF2867 family)
MSMIFVIGGTGTVGRSLLAELAAAGAPARVLVRDEEKAAAVSADGFIPVHGELEQPLELQRVLADVESLFLLSPQHPRQGELQDGAVEAARLAGVERIVKLSGSRPVTGESSPSRAGRAHAQTERRIEESGVGYTFLRPSYFMQNLLAFAEPIRGGLLPVPLGDAAVAMVDTRDVGAAAARILLAGGRHDGQIYELTGPESLGCDEVAARLSRILGHEVRYTNPTPDAAAESMRARGAPDWLVQHVQEIMGIMRSGAGAPTTSSLAELLGRPPRPFDEFARDHADMLGAVP